MKLEPKKANLKMRGVVCGMGINDSPFAIQKTIDGKIHRCQAYIKWERMLTRCYGKRAFGEHRVCNEWLSLVAFEKWMAAQDWKGRRLKCNGDVYSPDTCEFVDS